MNKESRLTSLKDKIYGEKAEVVVGTKAKKTKKAKKAKK